MNQDDLQIVAKGIEDLQNKLDAIKKELDNLRHIGGAGGGMAIHGNEYHKFDSDLLPAIPEAYSIGVKDKGWLRAVFEARDIVNDLFARMYIGSQCRSDHPNTPDYAIPYIEFIGESPIGTPQPTFQLFYDPPSQTLFFRFYSTDTPPVAKDILTFTYPNFFSVDGEFIPSTPNDFGNFSNKWRDIGQIGWLIFGDIVSRGITLPTPSSTYRLAGIGFKGGSGVKDYYKICRKRSAGDYQYFDVLDPKLSIAILKEVNGITKTDIGTTATEILGVPHRSKIDLLYFDKCRVVFGGSNNEAQIFYCRIEYSTDQITWVNLTAEGASNGTTNEQLVVGAWGNIPTGALSDVFIRAVGRAGNATADPIYKTIELQVK